MDSDEVIMEEPVLVEDKPVEPTPDPALEAAIKAKADFEKWHTDRGHKFLQPGEPVVPVEWLCENFFTMNSSSLLSAKAKSGKSALVESIAIGCASGTGAVRSLSGGWLFDFKGKKTKTFYLDTENSRSLVIRRLTSLAEEVGLKLDDLLSSGYLTVDCLEASVQPPFLDPKRETIEDDLFSTKNWADLVKANGYGLVVLDVMSHCYQEENGERDELSQGYMRDFFKIINTIKSSGAHVLLVHHHKKGNGSGNEQASGSSQMLRTPETLCTLTKLPEDENPEGDLFTLYTEGRQIEKESKKWLKARGSKDGNCRVFDEVAAPVEEKKTPGRQAGDRQRIAEEILDAVLEYTPRIKGAVISPGEWLKEVHKLPHDNMEWDKTDTTIKDYLKTVLVRAERVEKIEVGKYKIME